MHIGHNVIQGELTLFGRHDTHGDQCKIHNEINAIINNQCQNTMDPVLLSKCRRLLLRVGIMLVHGQFNHPTMGQTARTLRVKIAKKTRTTDSETDVESTARNIEVIMIENTREWGF